MPNPKGVVLTQRDRVLLSYVGIARYASAEQVHRLLFDGRSKKQTYRRLAKPCRAGDRRGDRHRSPLPRAHALGSTTCSRGSSWPFGPRRPHRSRRCPSAGSAKAAATGGLQPARRGPERRAGGREAAQRHSRRRPGAARAAAVGGRQGTARVHPAGGLRATRGGGRRRATKWSEPWLSHMRSRELSDGQSRARRPVTGPPRVAAAATRCEGGRPRLHFSESQRTLAKARYHQTTSSGTCTPRRGS